MIEWFKVIVLGIVEGITEFLPISSTGHLIIAAAVLNFQNNMNGTFEIFIQLGAVVAVIIYYSRDLFGQLRAIPSDRRIQTFWLGIVIAVVPAGIAGFLLRNWIKAVLFNPTVVAVSLILGGVVFILVERHPHPAEQITTDEVTHVTLRQAIIVGLAQTVALVPGVSRSGAAIIGGMQAGLNRETATRFSFYLAIPTLGGATILDLVGSLSHISTSDLYMLILGAAVSAVIAWISIGWLLRYVAHHTFMVFGYYRIIAGILILVLVSSNI